MQSMLTTVRFMEAFPRAGQLLQSAVVQFAIVHVHVNVEIFRIRRMILKCGF